MRVALRLERLGAVLPCAQDGVRGGKPIRSFKVGLYAYSPYQHAKPGVKYPAVLFMTGDGDTRVAPLHARKMAALLQADTASGRPVLLRYELTAGHSAGRSVTQDIGDSTDELSFLFWQLGIAP